MHFSNHEIVTVTCKIYALFCCIELVRIWSGYLIIEAWERLDSKFGIGFPFKKIRNKR